MSTIAKTKVRYTDTHAVPIAVIGYRTIFRSFSEWWLKIANAMPTGCRRTLTRVQQVSHLYVLKDVAAWILDLRAGRRLLRVDGCALTHVNTGANRANER